MDALSGDDKPEKSAGFNVEYTFVRVEPDTVVLTAKKDIAKMSGVVLAVG